MTKKCSWCGEDKPANSDHFYPWVDSRNGAQRLSSRCKPCGREKAIEWHNSHRVQPQPELHAGTRLPLSAADLTPCKACGLRGHEAGDPDRCLRGVATLGMGAQSWV